MGMDQLGVLTVGVLVPKEGGHTLSPTPCLPFPLCLTSLASVAAIIALR